MEVGKRPVCPRVSGIPQEFLSVDRNGLGVIAAAFLNFLLRNDNLDTAVRVGI